MNIRKTDPGKRWAVLTTGILTFGMIWGGCVRGSSDPCTGADIIPGLADAEALFDQSRSGGFFDFPFPSDLQVNPGGTIDLDGFPTGSGFGKLLFDSYLETAGEITFGFGLNSPVYFRFSQPVLSCSVPGELADPSAGDPVFLVTLSGDPSFVPLQTRLVEEPGGDPFLTEHLLALLPEAGYPLESGKAYLAVITDRVLGGNGRPVRRSAAGNAFLNGEESALGDVLRLDAVRSRLAGLGVAEERVVAVTVFTTQDVVTQYRLLKESVDQVIDDGYLEITGWREVERMAYSVGTTPSGNEAIVLTVDYTNGEQSETYFAYETDHRDKTVEINQLNHPYRVFEGWINTVSFQGPGGKPFTTGGEFPIGDLDLDTGRMNFQSSGGELRLTSLPQPEPMRITVLIPHDGDGELLRECSVLVWDHGTGGSAYNPVQRVEPDDDGSRVLEILASHGVAVVSRDQPLFGKRYEVVDAGLNPWVTFYNFLNIGAFRDNFRQAGIDTYVLSRLVRSRLNDFLVQQGLAEAPDLLDPEPFLKFGHSLGGFTSQLALGFLSGEGFYREAFLSGAGGLIALFISDSLILRHLVQYPEVQALLPLLGLADVDDTITFPELLGAMSGIPAEVLDRVDRFHPLFGLFQTLVDPGDPINFSREVDIPVTYLMGIGDWQVPNSSTRALINAVADAELVECEPTGDYDPHYCTFREEEAFREWGEFFSRAAEAGFFFPGKESGRRGNPGKGK